MRTRSVMIRAGAALLAAALVAACGGRPDHFDQPLEVSGPIAVGRYLVYLDQSRNRVTILRPAGEPGDRVRNVPVGRRPAFVVPTPDRRGVLVLCRGFLAQTRDEVDEAPSLHAVALDSGASEIYALGSPYDRLALSPDGRHAVAFYAAGVFPSEDEVWRNPNSVALLDLTLPGPDAPPVEKTVRSFGDVPLGVLFSPPTMAPLEADGTPGAARTLAVVFADGYLTLLDADRPDRREITVRLSLGETGQALVPDEMIFVPEAGAAFVRATGTDDVYVLTFHARTPEQPNQHDFVVSINTLAAGQTPADIAHFTDAEGRKILVANRGSHDLSVIDAATSEFVNIHVGDPVDRLLLYPAESPEVATIFSQGSRRTRIHFLDLAGVTDAGAQNLSTLHLDQEVVSVELIPGRAQALVIHDDTRTALSVLDLSDRTLSPITSHGLVGQYAFGAGGAVLAGFSFGRDQLGVIDLGNLSSRTLQLRTNPSGVLALAPAQGENEDEESQTVVVVHDDPFGLITVVPHPGELDRASTFQLSGFLLTGWLDERLER